METNFIEKNKIAKNSTIFYKIVSEEGFILWSETIETNNSFSAFINNTFGEKYEYFDENKQIAKLMRISEIDKTKEFVFVQLIAYPDFDIELDLDNLYVDEFFNLN